MNRFITIAILFAAACGNHPPGFDGPDTDPDSPDVTEVDPGEDTPTDPDAGTTPDPTPDADTGSGSGSDASTDPTPDAGSNSCDTPGDHMIDECPPSDAGTETPPDAELPPLVTGNPACCVALVAGATPPLECGIPAGTCARVKCETNTLTACKPE